MMYFKDVTGQEAVKRMLTADAAQGRVAHARLLQGQAGRGGLPLALAYARYLHCAHPQGGDACGRCRDCLMHDALAHPDLHFAFPVVKRGGKDTVSDDFLPQWRSLIRETAYFGPDTWMQRMEADNRQAQIFVKESDMLMRKLSLKPSRGGYKVAIVWLPERMNTECANKLLKMLEEPPPMTVFVLVSEEPDALPETLLSRTQRIQVPRIDEESLVRTLTAHYGLTEADARGIAHRAEGDRVKAEECIRLNEGREELFESFVALMRMAYQRRAADMKRWSDEMAAAGRERQKQFLAYALAMVRENFVYNFGRTELTHLDDREGTFATRFAPFVNERNVIALTDELNEALRHIGQNVNARMVFFDLALKTTVLLVQK